MTDKEKEEVQSIIREELGNMLQEASKEIASNPNITGQQLIDKLIGIVARRSTPKPAPRSRLSR